MKREENWQDKKKDYKKHKKDLKKQNKIKKKVDDENLKVKDPELYEKIHPVITTKNPPKKEVKKNYVEHIKKGIKIIIDCGFEKFMNDKDIISINRQITSCYSYNKKTEKPLNFILYDVGEKLKFNLLKNNCQKWLGFKFIEEGKFKNIKDFIYNEFPEFKIDKNFNSNKINKNFESEEILSDNRVDDSEVEKVKNINENIIYLTGDSSNEIVDLDKDKIYIIGGLVDRNKLKYITLNKANELNISHAKLPIRDFVNLKTSKILATNHVFEILSYFVNVKNDWKESFTSIIPKRKLEDEENFEDEK